MDLKKLSEKGHLPMNFFHNQIIKNKQQAQLFAASHWEIEKKNYETHVAAIQSTLRWLVKEAIWEGEDPKALLEDFLQVPYASGDTVDEFVDFLCNTHHMVHAFDILRENWNNLDDTVPGDSLMYATSEVDEQQGYGIYLESTLRSYLEVLSLIYHD